MGGYLAYKLARFLKFWFIDPQLSPLKSMPGPDNYDSLLWGDFRRILSAPPSSIYRQWFAKYGHSFSYRGMFLTRRLCTKDPKALAYILNHSSDYPKPAQLRKFLGKTFGKGIYYPLSCLLGEDHRRQRKIMNPCFGPSQVRELMPVFYDKAFELREIWLGQIETSESEGEDIDILVWLTRTTLDVIGLAGFDYDFKTLSIGEKDELIQAFMGLFNPTPTPPILPLLANAIPILQLIVLAARSKAVMQRVGQKLVQDRRTAIAAASDTEEGKSMLQGKDLLSVLIKANMAADIKDSERLSDEEFIGQISTMLLAGHETTSTTVTWLMYELAQPDKRHIQETLRAELISVSSNRPSMEELNALPYLDAVVRENLRLNSAADITTRCAGKDDYIPVGTPFVDKFGIERTEIRIAAGEQIIVPISILNRDKEIWGDDADDFNPERWLGGNTHPRSAELPGVFASLMTFLGGPRSCIGYRFALMEMKVLIFVLLRKVSFELQNPAPKIEKKSASVLFKL
ncbi:hypothetical protein M407DRAFT_74089 [Tulasnella calospora MUT 4182]|uniref:Cytochrome P450 n=1 Tax=Tulasnella calospora MUT 4182 TaxID=1051891 RepID=A0A0C3KZD5_9AGAM|nr:hypothetical protein M407DRAFT_74089 [Tulasnella calospora MUT 4182]